MLLQPARTRPERAALWGYCAGAALLNAALAAASAAATISMADQWHVRWAAVPSTAAIVGTAAGALLLTAVMVRRGRGTGLLLGYAGAVSGGALAVQAVLLARPVLLVLGMLLLGIGNAAAQLSRYAAAEVHPPQQRGSAIAKVVWASTLGAVGGPLLLGPAGDVAESWDWPALAGAFVVATAASAGAAVTTGVAVKAPPPRARRFPLRPLLRRPHAVGALAAMGTAQVVMVLVMTATPLHLHLHGADLRAVGAALSVHTLGMFALAPVTGRQVDRLGAHRVLVAGVVVLAAALALLLIAPSAHGGTSLAGLFALGHGWNMCFIGGSSSLSGSLPLEQQLAVEGAVDSAVWSAAALASLSSTVALSLGGFPLVTGVACALLVVPTVLLARGPRTNPVHHRAQREK